MTRTRAQAALAETVVHALLAGDVLALQPLVALDVLDHSAQIGQPPGWRGLRERVMTLCASLPAGDVAVDVINVAGDTVLARATLTAVRRATGPEPVEVTGVLTVALVLKFEGELLVELWTSPDLAADAAADVAADDDYPTWRVPTG
jgi:SnoaL-like domain